MFLKLSKFFLNLSIFSVVVVMTSVFFPFIGGKYYFFRFAVELALICFILWWAFEARPHDLKEFFSRITAKPLFIAVSVFVLAYLLASIFAYDPNAAFWSNYERGEGGFQMIHYYVFFLLLVGLFREWADWRLAFRLSLLAGGLMILYGICANFLLQGFVSPYQDGTPPSTWWGLLTKARFQGSLGNPAYVAPYLIFSLFYLFYLWCEEKSRRMITSFGYGFLALFFLFFFALSQTRGAFLGLVASIAVFFVYLIVALPRARKVIVSVAAALVVVGALLFAFKDNPAIRALPGSRFLDLRFGEQTVQTRLWTWNSAWQGVKERPIFGWGPENFSVVFDKYFDTRHYIPGESSETWFDRAHSVIFDYLAETGFIGFLSYLAIFVVFYYEFFRKVIGRSARRDAEHPRFSRNVHLAHALIFALPVAYLIQGLALFDVLPIYINLFFFLAFSVYLLEEKSKSHA